MAERLLRDQPVSVANHVKEYRSLIERSVTWLATESGWARSKRSAMCSGKLCGGFIIFRAVLPLCRSSTIAFVGHRQVPSAANQHTSWRSLIRCCWTSRMEQSVNPAARVGHYTRTISTSTQNASVLVTDSYSAEWQCFSCVVYNVAYLLTYLIVATASLAISSSRSYFVACLRCYTLDTSRICFHYYDIKCITSRKIEKSLVAFHFWT